jgi:hypothetical protein
MRGLRKVGLSLPPWTWIAPLIGSAVLVASLTLHHPLLTAIQG